MTGKHGYYELLELIGHGTSANVFLAKDTLLDRRVALKVLEGQSVNPDQFLEEGRKLARLQHPNIVGIHAANIVDDKYIIDMEYVEGLSLKTLLARKKQLPVSDALSIVAQLLHALAYAHEKPRNLIHRDIKPANVLVTTDGNVKLADFGTSDVVITNAYIGGAGTYPYMAPEDFASRPSSDKRSDLWAIGVILYELLTGRWPFRAEDINNPFLWKAAIENAKAPPLIDYMKDVPEHLQGIVDGALSRNKHQRFQTAPLFLDALKRFGLYNLPLSEEEFRTIDRFTTAFNRITNALRDDLGPDPPPNFTDLVRAYSNSHPKWMHRKELYRLAGIRNSLSHKPTKPSEFRRMPLLTDVKYMEEIERSLLGKVGYDELKTPLFGDEEIQNTPSIVERPQDDELPTVLDQLLPASRTPTPVSIRAEDISQKSSSFSDDYEQWVGDWKNTLRIALDVAARCGIQLDLRGDLTYPTVRQSGDFPSRDTAVAAGRDFYLKGEEIRCNVEEAFVLKIKAHSLQVNKAKKRLVETEGALSSRWQMAEKKKAQKINRVKNMSSGLTPRSLFYNSSEKYVEDHLRPTVVQNVVDQFEQQFTAIDAERQRVLPVLRAAVCEAETVLKEMEETVQWLKTHMASPKTRATTVERRQIA